jgi:hypothetical protein
MLGSMQGAFFWLLVPPANTFVNQWVNESPCYSLLKERYGVPSQYCAPLVESLPTDCNIGSVSFAQFC